MTLFLTHLVMLFITHFEKLFVTHFVTLFVTHFLTLLYRILYNAFCRAFFNALCNAYFLHRITVDNKGFSGIQKSEILLQNRNFNFCFSKNIYIKMERLSSGPSWALLLQFPYGDKNT